MRARDQMGLLFERFDVQLQRIAIESAPVYLSSHRSLCL
jgi:hypothetical protein